MKYLITTFLLLLFFSIPFFPKTGLSRSIFVDEYFDIYDSNLSWEKQKARLDNFASHLAIDPELVGYIGFSGSKKKESFQKAKAKINRSVKYLTEHCQIEKNRIVVIYVGEKEESQIILQPVIKSMKPPFESAVE